MTTARTLLTDFKATTDAGLDLESRTDLEKLVVELQGLLEERNKLDTKDFSTRSKAAKALWLDKLAEIDTRFKLEKFVDKVIAADVEHPNSDLFNRIFDLLDVLRNDNSLESANPMITIPSRNGASDLKNNTLTSDFKRQASRVQKSKSTLSKQPSLIARKNASPEPTQTGIDFRKNLQNSFLRMIEKQAAG